MFLNIFKFLYYILYLQFSCVLSLFDQCNHKVDMKSGEKIYVNSPYYPAEYPIGSSCRYTIKAPEDYELKFKCSIKLNTPSTATKCLNEIFYFNREGSEVLTGSEYFCGTGKMERKSFLNQAVISYISTPYYKRILTNVVTDDEEEEVKMKETTTKAIRTTNKRTTTSKPLKQSHWKTTKSTMTTTTRKTTPIPKTSTLLTTSHTQPSSSSSSSSSSSDTFTSSLSSFALNEVKNVNNSFAYVVALLSNKISIKDFPTTTTTTSTTPTTTQSPITASTHTHSYRSLSVETKPTTSVLNFYDFLPEVNTWHNGSIAIHKISSKRVSKVIVVGQDYTSSPHQQQIPFTSASSSSLPSSSFSSSNTRLSVGGGSFSCLVEVIEPQCECGWGSTTKIAGASGVAGINEFPSMAGVMTIKNLKIFCGATIIHHRYLLSAAHCYITPETNRPEYLRVVVGEHDLSTVLESINTRQYDISDIISHENFRATTSKVHNDIALLRTRYAMEWNRSVGPVCLPFYTLTGKDHTLPIAGQRLETTGWGTTSFGGQQSSVLLKTTLDVISRAECQRTVRSLPVDAFCTYTPGRDACQYDSGGALYARRERLYAVGIISYGFACATNQPSVNTRVVPHLKWIRSKTSGVKYCLK